MGSELSLCSQIISFASLSVVLAGAVMSFSKGVINVDTFVSVAILETL